LDEATALVGNMEAAGLSASKMMPGLNTAVQKLAKEGVTDISAGLMEMIASIENAETETEALAIATSNFGAGAGVRFKDAIDKGVFSLEDMLAAMENSEGKVAELGATTLTMSDKFDIMKNRVKGALSPIGNLATALGPMVIMFPALVTGITAMASSQLVATAATYAQATAMAVLNVAMGPIGLIILGIVAAVALAIAIFKNWDKVVGLFNAVIAKIKPVFTTVKTFLLGALENLKGRWDTIWNGMKDAVKLIVNPIIGFINLIIKGINFMIAGLNTISVKVPDWVPLIGGKGFTFNIPMIPSIPKMAAGGIVRSPTLAMLGEAGPEAVIPLGRGGMGGGITINILGPTYGFDDFEQRVSEAISDGVRRGGFSGILAPA